MKRVLLLMALILGLTGTQASAQMLSVSWSTVRQVNYTFDGNARTANAGPAHGFLGAEDLGLIYCVDLFNQADNPSSYMVDVHYDDTGWLVPVGDGDDLRRADGLWRAAWLMNHFSQDANNAAKRFGLNVAIWVAVYGDRFQYQSGLLSSEVAAMNNYLTAWNGQQEMSVRWFDNNDVGPYHQDFIQAVPEPGTLLLLGGGLLSAAFLRRRRQS